MICVHVHREGYNHSKLWTDWQKHLRSLSPVWCSSVMHYGFNQFAPAMPIISITADLLRDCEEDNLPKPGELRDKYIHLLIYTWLPWWCHEGTVSHGLVVAPLGLTVQQLSGLLCFCLTQRTSHLPTEITYFKKQKSNIMLNPLLIHFVFK